MVSACVSYAAGSCQDGCVVDCKFQITVCPVPDVDEPMCNGHGVCIPTTGICDCFGGYTGHACELCATGYAVYFPASGCVKVRVLLPWWWWRPCCCC